MSQVITVTFAQGQYEAVADQPLAQWAYGQKLKFVGLDLPAAYAVDFSNWEFQGDSIQRIGNADGVAVPTEILTSGRNVYAFIWITDANSGRRRYMAMARVIPGPGPDPEEPNPQESSEISEVLAELNAAVETAEDAASRGPQIRDGYWYTWNAESQEYENTEVPSTGNKIWWTTAAISTIPGSRYVVLLPNLNGPAGAFPAVPDLVVGPAPNTSGSATYLYYIFGIDITNQQVILKSIGSIKGAQGAPGDDGVSPSVSVSEITGGHQVSFTDAQGTETFDVMNGLDGPAGPSGGQFWTAQSASTSPDYTWSFSNLIGPDDETPAVGDIIFYSIYRYTVASVDLQNQKVTCTARTSLRGPQGQPGQGVPASGDQAQVLSKKSATDYDTQWSDVIDLLPSTFKAALLQLAQKVAYIDDRGSDYYQDLYDALYPPAELVSISAVFTQGQTVVYDTDNLDILKSMLVVTGTYDDQSTETIPSTGYTLSGTLTAGTSTVTVSYGGKTTTFTVTVTASLVPSGYTAYDYVAYVGANKASASESEMILTKKFDNLNAVKIDFDFMPLKAQTGSTAQLVGGRSANGNDNVIAIYARTDTKRVSAFSHGTAIGIDNIATIAVNSTSHVTLDPGSASPSTLTVDASSQTGAWATSNTVNQSLAICGTIQPGSKTLNYFAGIGILRIYDTSGTLIGEYVPCVRDADSVIGLYDTVTETFYTAATTDYVTVGGASCEYSVGSWEV